MLFSKYQLLLILKILLTFFYLTGNLNGEVNGTEPSLSVSVPWLGMGPQRQKTNRESTVPFLDKAPYPNNDVLSFVNANAGNTN